MCTNQFSKTTLLDLGYFKSSKSYNNSTEEHSYSITCRYLVIELKIILCNAFEKNNVILKRKMILEKKIINVILLHLSMMWKHGHVSPKVQRLSTIQQNTERAWNRKWIALIRSQTKYFDIMEINKQQKFKWAEYNERRQRYANDICMVYKYGIRYTYDMQILYSSVLAIRKIME